MAKFAIDWMEKVWYTTVIEADDIEEAKRLFFNYEGGSREEIDNTFEYITHIEEIE
jgi:hypothetical protein